MHVVWVNEAARFQGGAERYVADTAKGLARRGFRNTLLYETGGPMDPAFTACFDGAFPMVDLEAQLARLDPDLLYLHNLCRCEDLEALARFPAPGVRFFHDHALFCLRTHKYTTLGRKTCTRTTGWNCYPCLGFLQRAEHWPGIGVQRLGTLQRKQAASRALQAFVVGSGYMRDHVAAHGFPREKIHVLPLYTAPPPAPAGLPRSSDRILFVGQLIRGKGVDLLLRAMERLPDVRLRILGNGPQEGELRRQAERAGLDARVEFSGRIPREEMQKAYAQAACLVVPSRSAETFGLVGIEALRHATPVIASRAGGVGEWLLEGETGLLFPPGDTQALAARIAELLSDPEAARRMGERGRRLVTERFLPEAHLDALQALFTSLALHPARK